MSTMNKISLITTVTAHAPTAPPTIAPVLSSVSLDLSAQQMYINTQLRRVRS